MRVPQVIRSSQLGKVRKPNGPQTVQKGLSHRIRSGSNNVMGSMEASTAPENGSSAAGGGAGGTACNGAGAASNGGGMERRLRSSASAASASWAAHLPLEVGTRVMCRWRDQKLHPVKVIERRKGPACSSPADYEYYVHYTECKEPPCLASRQDACCLGLGEFWPRHLTR